MAADRAAASSGRECADGGFATRSPFRLNPIGLSCVRLDCVRIDKERGPVLSVSGIDMRNGTEIYDIKPYLPHIDARPGGKRRIFRDCSCSPA